MTLLDCFINTSSFWSRNQGAFLGAFGAGIVAIISAYLSSYLTHKKAIERDLQAIKKNLQKESSDYSGILSLIHTELNAHKSHLSLLINSLKKLKESSIENQIFVIDKLPMKFDLSIINNGLNLLHKFSNYDHRIMIFLVSYKNLIMGANTALEFNNANRLLSSQKNISNTGELIASYFNVLDTEYLNKIEPLISDIRKLIERNVNDSDKLIFKELTDI